MPEKRITFFRSTLTAKGQITIPRQIRRFLGLRSHQYLFLHTDGSSIIISTIDPETSKPLTKGRPTTLEVGKTAGARAAISHFKNTSLR